MYTIVHIVERGEGERGIRNMDNSTLVEPLIHGLTASQVLVGNEIQAQNYR